MEFKSLNFEVKAVDMEERTFEGYAATWDEDQVGDTIVRGAFKKTLKERGDRVKVLFEHRHPIGVPLEMKEDNRGLWVKARISRTPTGDETLQLINDGVIDAMSIGFSVVPGKSMWDDEGIKREIREVKLYEFSAVTFPANENALIETAKRLTTACKGGMIEMDSKSIEKLREMLSEIQALVSDAEQEAAIVDDESVDGGTSSDGGEPQQEEDSKSYEDILAEIKQMNDFARLTLY